MDKIIHDFLESEDAQINISLTTYDYERHNLPQSRAYIEGLDGEIIIDKSTWKVVSDAKPDKQRKNCINVSTEFRCESGEIEAAAVGINLVFNNWTEENYVLFPAAAYNGNRYESRPQPYMPFFYNYDDLSHEPKIILSDVPRLNSGPGLSRIQERSGSMSTPSLGFYSPSKKRGFFLLTNQGTYIGDHGLSFEENRDRTRAFLFLTNPVVRELYQYNMTNTHYNTKDLPTNFKQGDSVRLYLKLHFFDCESIQHLYNVFNEIRYTIPLNYKEINILPYSEAFKVLRKKFNTQNYNEKIGYYRVGMGENAFQDWQIGWTGGMISTYPLLFKGDEITRNNVKRNFEWLFEKAISPGGLFWGIGENGNKFYGEFEQTKPLGKNLILVRKQGDAIYYIIKQFMLMDKLAIDIDDHWKEKLKGVIETLIEVWNSNGQLGHYLNIHTNEVIIGGSTSGGIVPGALCLAGRYFENKSYIDVAEKIGLYYFETYVIKGLTYGGVGDAMHNFDSESAYGLLESFALLFEATGNKKWLDISEKMAQQFATWVINYDYAFPENSLFGKLKMQTKGTVFANTQNKHLAPGICTYSGIALLRIFRATKKTFYINLLRDIVRAIPQYLSHPDRPIPGMKEGWISERVNSTDWWEPIGEIFCGSTWSETSCMLSHVEIPGIYVIPEMDLIVCSDNVEAEIVSNQNQKFVFEIINKTAFNAEVTLMSERLKELDKPLNENKLLNADKIIVPAKNKITYIIDY